MKRLLFSILILTTILGLTGTADAMCRRHTIFTEDGRMIQCTTCCYGNNCTTNCF